MSESTAPDIWGQPGVPLVGSSGTQQAQTYVRAMSADGWSNGIAKVLALDDKVFVVDRPASSALPAQGPAEDRVELGTAFKLVARSTNEAEGSAPKAVHVVATAGLQLPQVQLLQQWEGTVVDMRATGFSARLRDVADPAAPMQEAVIELEAVTLDDLPLVQPGAVFYWSIVTRTEPHGQKINASILKFRRLPAWSNRDIERVRERAARFDEFFRNE